MATEIELKLALTPATARALERHPLLANIEPTRHRLLNTYYDTPDLRLKAQCVALRFRKKGWQTLLTVKSAEPASGGLAQRSEWEAPATPGQWDFAHLDQPALRAMLEAAAPELEALFTTHFRRLAWTLPVGASVIELALDRGQIESQGRRSPICEVELELVSGEIADLFALARRLQANLTLRPSAASKAERGYALFAGEAPASFKARLTPLDEEANPIEAFRRIALTCLEQLQRNEDGVIHGSDPEFVHQARVALRRLRSALKLFSPALPADFTLAWSEAWQTLATALGEARNWDVLIIETLPPIAAAFPDHRPLQKLLAQGRRQASNAQAVVGRLLTVDEYPRLVTEFSASLYALTDDGPTPRLADFAFEQLNTRARRARKLALRHATLTAEERHRMRLAFKKLRYTLEFFSSLLPRHKLKAYLAALAHLQDELGLINDHVTAAELINSALGEHRAGPVQGWIAGRHALLVAELPTALDTWLAQRTPWKSR